jgi:hypothetical protein
MRRMGSATTASSSTACHQKEVSRAAVPKTAEKMVRPFKTLAAVGVRIGSEGFPQNERRTPGFARVRRTSAAALMHAARINKTTPRTWTRPMAASLHAASGVRRGLYGSPLGDCGEPSFLRRNGGLRSVDLRHRAHPQLGRTANARLAAK